MLSNDENDREVKDHLENLSKRLYSSHPISKNSRPGHLRDVNYHAPTEWADDSQGEKRKFPIPEYIEPKQSVFKKFFIFSLVFLGICLVFAGYMFFIKGTPSVSSQNIDMTVLGNAFTPGGEDLPLQIEIKNRNSTSLEYADIIIEYPKGSYEPVNPGDYVRLRKSIGTVSPGKTITEEMSVVLYGAMGTTKDVKITLEYRIPGSNAILIKEKNFTVNISSVPLELTIDAPEKTGANQEFSIKAKIIQNSTEVPENLVLKMEYPSGFKYIGADIEPIIGNSLWEIQNLKQGEEKIITIRGLIQAQNGEERSIRAFLGERSGKNNTALETIYDAKVHVLAIEKPFLEARLAIDGDTRDIVIASPEQRILGSINWRNNLEGKIINGTIVAKISGAALDKTSIKTDKGFYNSKTNEITWDKNTNSELAEINPGDNDVVDFEFASLPLEKNGLSANPEINISISIKGTLPEEENTFKTVDSFENKTVRFRSKLTIDTDAMYSGGPFTNSGPVPPTAEQETTYTISWKLTNTTNSLENVEMKGVLPVYVKFTNLISPNNESVTYNPGSREVIWKVGNLDRGTGILEPSRILYFQVAATPSISQVGKYIELMKDVKATGSDTFTKMNISINGANISTGNIESDGRVKN